MIDPIASTVLSMIAAAPGTTEELAKRLPEPIPRSRLSAILHGLRKAGNVGLERHCRVEDRFRPRQEWVKR